MKLKTIITCLSLLGASALNAQIITSTSQSITEIKKASEPRFTHWVLKAGPGLTFGSFTTYYDDSETKIRPSYNVSVGFERQINGQGVYWGAQLGSSMAHIEEDSDYYDSYSNRASFFFGPTLGLFKPISNHIDIDGHIGCSYELTPGASDISNIAPEVGIGIWLDRFLLELDYRGYYNFGGTYGNRVLLNVGYRF